MAKGDKINHTEVFDFWGWVCHLCGEGISRHAGKDDWMKVTLDHVIPLSRGGTHTWDNVRPAHRKCNERKGNDI